MTADAATSPHPPPESASQRFRQTWRSPRGVRGFFRVVQHKQVGVRYMVTAFVMFLVGGIQAMFMRAQLVAPDSDLISSQTYNELFTMHGTTMMFLFAVPFLEGLATYLLPLMIGSRDLPFPRYNAFNYWCYVLGALILYSSYLFALVPSSGWFAYVPLSGPEFADRSMDFWLFGLTLAEIAAVGAAIEIAVGVLRCRAPGMALNRMPIFAWTMLAVAFLIIVAFVPLLVASILLELDRVIGTAFFDTASGGSPLLWQHLFWIFGHPEVYVMFLPGAAIISHIIPVHSRHPLVGYPLIVIAISATAVMSLGLWVHHMYATGLPSLTLGFFTAASMSIALASGLQVFAWLATLGLGRPRMTVPMLYAIGFIATFVLGGITGVMVASVSFNTQVHDTYFIVAHLHYVLIGGMLFPILAAMHHWWGKVTGRTYARVPAVVAFWLIFVGFHTTFFPMHLAGLWGMPRRVYTYEADLGVTTVNVISTIGVFTIAVGVLVLITTFVVSWRSGARAEEDPWGGDTLEWLASSPPSDANWERIPIVASRHPAWDREDRADERHADDIDEAFEMKPLDFRATPTTTVLSGEPDGAALLSGPTIWPLVPPVGLAIIAVAMLTQWYPIALLGLLIVGVGLGGWAVRNESEYTEKHVQPLGGVYAFEGRRSGSIGWWAASATVIVMLVGMTTLAFSALYLQVNASVWPLESTIDRPVTFGAIAVLLAIGFGATWLGGQRDGADGVTVGPRPHLIAAGVALAAGGVALALVLSMLLGDDLDPAAHAYESSVWVLLGGAALTMTMALCLSVVAVLARLMHRRDVRAARQLHNAALLWGASLIAWALVWATSELFPVLVI